MENQLILSTTNGNLALICKINYFNEKLSGLDVYELESLLYRVIEEYQDYKISNVIKTDMGDKSQYIIILDLIN